MVGWGYACHVRSLRFSSEHQTRCRQHSAIAVADRLVVPCAAVGPSAGYHLVGAVLWPGRQLAVRPPPAADLATRVATLENKENCWRACRFEKPNPGIARRALFLLAFATARETLLAS